MIGNNLIQLGILDGSGCAGIFMVGVGLVILVLLLSIGFEEDDFFGEMGSWGYNRSRASDFKLVPIVDYKKSDDGGLKKDIKYAKYKDYLTNWEYKWEYIDEIKDFGWVSAIPPQVSMILSPGMQEKIDEILKNKEDSI